MNEDEVEKFYDIIAELAKKYGVEYAERVHNEVLYHGGYEDRRVRIRITRTGSIEVLLK